MFVYYLGTHVQCLTFSLNSVYLGDLYIKSYIKVKYIKRFIKSFPRFNYDWVIFHSMEVLSFFKKYKVT